MLGFAFLGVKMVKNAIDHNTARQEKLAEQMKTLPELEGYFPDSCYILTPLTKQRASILVLEAEASTKSYRGSNSPYYDYNLPVIIKLPDNCRMIVNSKAYYFRFDTIPLIVTQRTKGRNWSQGRVLANRDNIPGELWGIDSELDCYLKELVDEDCIAGSRYLGSVRAAESYFPAGQPIRFKGRIQGDTIVLARLPKMN